MCGSPQGSSAAAAHTYGGANEDGPLRAIEPLMFSTKTKRKSALRVRTRSRNRPCEHVEQELEEGPARDREGERARNAVKGTGGQSRGGGMGR